jgi:glycosyltransferase involved in cell wall biosynthesis
LNVRHYQIVHVHLANWQADAAAIACRVYGVPLYVKLASGGPLGEINRMRKISWITRFIGIRRAAVIQAISGEIERDVVGIGVPAERIVRIPNGLPMGVNEPLNHDERLRLRAELDLPQDRVIVVHAGRFAGYKGVLDLAEAWRGVDRSLIATLLVVGQRSIDDPVELPALPNMVLRGWTTEVARYLQAADIYAHPARADGMPNVVLEAMSCGLAIVATRQAAVPDMISDEVSGLLVSVGAVSELRTAMERLIGDASLRARLGHEASLRAHRDYQIESVVSRIIGAYEGMIGTRAAT